MPDEKMFFETKPRNGGIPKEALQANLGLTVGALGVDFILLQALLSLQTDMLTITTTIVIAVSITSLAAVISETRNYISFGFYFRKRAARQAGLTILGLLCTVVAVGMAFWHISWIAGIVFIVLGLAALGYSFSSPVWRNLPDVFTEEVDHKEEE